MLYMSLANLQKYTHSDLFSVHYLINILQCLYSFWFWLSN